jgi:hypothetical protein
MTSINLSRFRQDFPSTLVSPQEGKLAKIRGYEFDWNPYAKLLFDLDRAEDQPSWLKAVTDVSKAEGLWRGFYESLAGRTHKNLQKTNASDFALTHLVNDKVTGVMQFLPSNSTNEEALKVSELARAILSDWIVITLNGSADASNEDSERIVKDYVKKAQVEGKRGVWVISQGMGSRSFSIPEINVVLLTYDNGGIGPTIQKMSRCLTSSSAEKIGHIISFSIDGNRSDNIAAMALDTALKVAQESGESLEEVLRRVRRTIPIFDLDENGDSVIIKDDEYLERAMSLTAASQLVINQEAIYKLSFEDIESFRMILSDLPTNRERLADKSVPFAMGDRFVDSLGNISNSSDENSDDDDLRESIEQLKQKLSVLMERIKYLVFFLPDKTSVTLDRVVQFVESDPEIQSDFTETFGVSVTELLMFVNQGMINREMLELVMLKS